MLKPLGLLYGVVMRARRALYRRGVLSSFELGAPCISVGNITTGGTGKTPVAAWIAQALAREGWRVCVLTRGYGRADESRRVLVSDGARVLSNAREGGDEPLLLAEMLLGEAAVVSDANRVAAARWALENLASEVFILDDGFQHLRVRRDLDIVTVDATNPWGGGRLLPHGRLREPVEGLRRADLIIITRAEQADDIYRLKLEAERFGGGQQPVIISRSRTRVVRPLGQSETGPRSPLTSYASPATSYRAAAFCALGNPTAFFEHLRRSGYALTHTRAFPDHHVYTQRDADLLTREAQAHNAEALLTTAKDAVKLRQLRFELPCFVVELEIEFEDERPLHKLLRETVRAKR